MLRRRMRVRMAEEERASTDMPEGQGRLPCTERQTTGQAVGRGLLRFFSDNGGVVLRNPSTLSAKG